MYRVRKLALIEKVFLSNRFRRKIWRYAEIDEVDWQPDITISREPGSGGRLIAKRVARKLGWDFYDQKLLKRVAKRLKYPESFIEKIDERPRSKLTDLLHSLFNSNYISDYAYIKYLKEVIVKAAVEKNVVILGRGAHLIIPKDKVLRVKITAPFEVRVANAVRFEKLSPEKAREEVRKVEMDRRQFITQYFGEQGLRPESFDLVINTEGLSLDSAVELIIKAFEEKFGRVLRRTKTPRSRVG